MTANSAPEETSTLPAGPGWESGRVLAFGGAYRGISASRNSDAENRSELGFYNIIFAMSDSFHRPFYSEYAWAYDLIIDRPVHQECMVITTWLANHAVLPGALLLDAGCGTGRYSVELARRGYTVHGIDLSSEMVQTAKASIDKEPALALFAVGDLLSNQAERYDAILCRGVLNDMLDGRDRDTAFDVFAGCLKPGGVLILDVREWEASKARKTLEPVFRKRISTDRGELTYTSITDLDPENRMLRISEEHGIDNGKQQHMCKYHFVMRCWTFHELNSALTQHAFHNVEYFGAYDANIAQGLTDRIVAVAQLS